MPPSRRTAVYRRAFFLAAALMLVGLCYWLNRPFIRSVDNQHKLEGSTMGTIYLVRYVADADVLSPQAMNRLIDFELRTVNQQMSTYLKHSEISTFNDSSSTDWFALSFETAQVVQLAQQISVASNGAFDITVAPLVDLWGFGPSQRSEVLPSEAEIMAIKESVGYQNLEVRLDPPAIKKSIPMLRVDLSAIAKGHGVDRVGQLLRDNGVQDYFVEIGGEIAAHGVRSDGEPWQVGIEAPNEGERTIQSVIGLSNAAIATSGDYRNYYEVANQRYSHTIDPNTGRPVVHTLASASVIAENCALADAVATSMMVLGPEVGLTVAEANNWAVLLVHRDEGSLVSTCSKQFARQFPGSCSQGSIQKGTIR
ncbi:MAG: FAD:protein FMN transferase [Pirellulaceae bacterium]|nr:FAD:protein FMN transferase [Pirellulaceae bacterium]